MNIAVSIVVALSIAFGLLKRRFQGLASGITFFLMGMVLIDGLLGLASRSFLLNSINFPIVIILLTVESFLIWGLEQGRQGRGGLLPSYSVPVITFGFFTILANQINTENALIWLTMAILGQPFWSLGQIKKNYFNKKAIVGIVIFLLSLTAFLVYGDKNTGIVLVFLYWFSLDLIPLGLDKDSSRDRSYPLVNRVLLVVLFILNRDLSISFDLLVGAVWAITLGTIFSIIFTRDRLRNWLLYKRTTEALLLLIGLGISGNVSQSLILAILSFSIAAYVLRLRFSLRLNNFFSQLLLILVFMFSSGLLIGKPTEVISLGFKKAMLNGVGLSFFYFVIPLWLTSLVYGVIVHNGPQLKKESKIDHLQALFFLSAIMISVLLSL